MKIFVRRRLLLLIFLLIAGTGVPGAARPSAVRLGSAIYVRLADCARRFALKVRSGANRIEIFSPADDRARVVLFHQKNFGYFNSTKVMLLHPALIRQGGTMISAADMEKSFRPLLSPGRYFRHPVSRVVIDPGHGGKDKGALGNGVVEKNLTLQLAQRVAGKLRKSGFTVLLTRSNDRFIPLEQRPALAEKLHADLFISIHVNSTANPQLQGIECFCLTPPGASSSNASAPEKKSYPGNARDPNNLILAYHLQRSLLIRTGASDMGVKRARFSVLRNASCPAALVEIGFLSCPGEAKRLTNYLYQEKLADGIADGVLSYCISIR